MSSAYDSPTTFPYVPVPYFAPPGSWATHCGRHLIDIGELLRVYVLYVYWRQLGTVDNGALALVSLGLVAGVITTYVGWRVGLAG